MREIDDLIERAKKYLKSEQLLLEAGDYESCVSRAYYAMFFVAEAALLSKGQSFSSHKGVISGFGEHFIKTGILPKRLGRDLNRAFGKRQLGDYEYTFVISQEEAKEILEDANFFVYEVVHYLKNEWSDR